MDSNELPELFYEIFDPSLPRLNPGDEASTLRVLNMFRSAESMRLGQTTLPFMPRKRHAGSAENLSMIESVQKEIEIYRRYSAYYGSEFFVMRRR